jgi:hypothetical protein
MLVMTEHAGTAGYQLPKLIFSALFRFKWGPVVASLLWVLFGAFGK